MPETESPTPEEAADAFREHEKWAAAGLLGAERLLLRRLNEVATEATRPAIAAVSLAVGTDAQRKQRAIHEVRIAVPRLSLALSGAILDGRKNARASGAGVLSRELTDQVGYDPSADLVSQDDGSDDVAAHAAGQSVSASWSILAILALRKWGQRPDLSLPEALNASVRTIRPRIALVATTEGASAFNEERATRSVSANELLIARAQTKAERQGLTKFWSTFLDGKVCHRCRPMEGQAAPVDKPFVTYDGEVLMDPPLHPRCRCSAPVLWLGLTAANDVSELIWRK